MAEVLLLHLRITKELYLRLLSQNNKRPAKAEISFINYELRKYSFRFSKRNYNNNY